MLAPLPAPVLRAAVVRACRCARGAAGGAGLRPRSPTRARDVVKRKVAVYVAYDGGRFHGLQRNAGVETVADVLEGGLFRAGAISAENVGFLEKIKWTAAARTDKGVGAAGNVVSAKLLFPRGEDGCAAAVARVNAALPPHVRVLGISRVTASFSARTSCAERWYEYMLPLCAVAPGGPVRRFRATLEKYVATHSFHNFTVGRDHAVPPRAQANRFVTVATCDERPVVLPLPEGAAPAAETEWVRVRVRGSSFLLHMIRKMVSLALLVHRGMVPEDAIEQAFSRAVLVNVPPAPAVGLFLDACRFDWYNQRHSMYLDEPISLAPFDEERERFKREFIFPSIARRAAEEDSMGLFFKTVANHPPEFLDAVVSVTGGAADVCGEAMPAVEPPLSIRTITERGSP